MTSTSAITSVKTNDNQEKKSNQSSKTFDESKTNLVSLTLDKGETTDNVRFTPRRQHHHAIRQSVAADYCQQSLISDRAVGVQARPFDEFSMDTTDADAAGGTGSKPIGSRSTPTTKSS
ncbi:hypothetical protein I4U23_009397 [Adineta vaga]|nr:hypothetical protein I4U23_009397 [Adineta vaga]